MYIESREKCKVWTFFDLEKFEICFKFYSSLLYFSDSCAGQLEKLNRNLYFFLKK